MCRARAAQLCQEFNAIPATQPQQQAPDLHQLLDLPETPAKPR